MKVLVGSLTYPLPNGVTNSINESVDGFVAAGHEVVIVSPDYNLGLARPEHFPVPSSEVGRRLAAYFGKKERVFSLLAAPKIQKLINSFAPDAFWLHSVTYASNILERKMLSSGKPVVLTYHTMLDVYGRLYAGPVGEQTMILRSRELANRVDHVITPSQYMKHHLRRFGVTTPITVIPSGISKVENYYTKGGLSVKHHFPAANALLLYVGRVVKEKNIEVLLKMLGRLVTKQPNVTLMLVGPGDIDQTKQQAKDLGLTKNVILTGPLPSAEAQKYYGAADAFVFASQTETQGLVIGEAMMAGTPVVALDSPIQKEVYPEDVAVVVHRQADFAMAVEELLRSKQRQYEVGKAGKQFVEKNFSKETMVERQLAVFEQVLKPVEV